VQAVRDGILAYVDNAPANQPPVASFTWSCTDLICDFDGSASDDPDGTITEYVWDFGEGDPIVGSSPDATHEYSSGGEYAVTLTVTDDDAATDTATQAIEVGDTPDILVLEAVTRGAQKVVLSWSGSSATSYDIIRDGSTVATVSNVTTFSENVGRDGASSYIYKVCEAGTTICSNEVTVVF
jgi:PKD repeat protein